jgi:hypothetical protein
MLHIWQLMSDRLINTGLQPVLLIRNLLIFGLMQVQVDIAFEQLVKLAKQLPATQWKKLKNEVEKQVDQTEMATNLEQFLLSAPTFNKKQFDEIAKARKAIIQWRTT